MAEYGCIIITNVSLSDEMFCKVCETLRLITSHCIQDERTFYILGIKNNQQEFNVDRGCFTQQRTRFLDMVGFYLTRDFSKEINSGLECKYIE